MDKTLNYKILEFLVLLMYIQLIWIILNLLDESKFEDNASLIPTLSRNITFLSKIITLFSWFQT